MRRLAIALPLMLALAPAAEGAEVTPARACYLQDAKPPNVTVTGKDFPPSTAYSVFLDNAPLADGQGLTDPAGAFTGSFHPPSLGKKENERTFTVGVTSADQSASTTFTVTRFNVDFAPMRGLARNLRVRFSLYGFGLLPDNPHPDLYVHWIDPRDRWRATAYLGKGQGQCGSIVRTSKRRLFPFATTRNGLWHLQFDLRRKFKKGDPKDPRSFFYTVGVRVT